MRNHILIRMLEEMNYSKLMKMISPFLLSQSFPTDSGGILDKREQEKKDRN